MFEMKALVLRNIRVFLRDKTAVFVSFLSVIILLGVYLLFVGRQYTQGQEMEILSSELKTYLMVGQMMGGVLVVNTMTLSLGMMGNLINDIEYKRLDSLSVAPIKRYQLVFSYYIAAIIVSFVLSFFMWILTILYVGISSGFWYKIDTILITTLLLLLFVFISSSLMILLTTLIKSINAFGTLAGVLGTFIGFVSGIYMPLFVLGKSMTYVASVVPFTHMAISLRKTLLRDPYELLGTYFSDEGIASIESIYGTKEVGVLGQSVSIYLIYLFIVLLSALFLYIASKNMYKKISN